MRGSLTDIMTPFCHPRQAYLNKRSTCLSYLSLPHFHHPLPRVFLSREMCYNRAD